MKISHRPEPVTSAGLILAVMALILIPARSLVAQSAAPQKPTVESDADFQADLRKSFIESLPATLAVLLQTR